MPRGRSPARLFLDANVIFSAAHSPAGRCAALFALAERGSCDLLTSAYAVTEADRNLRRKRPQALERFAVLLDSMRVVPEPDAAKRTQAASLGLDLGDVPILAAAFGRCDILVTGDRTHFGFLMGRQVKSLRVMNPGDALSALM